MLRINTKDGNTFKLDLENENQAKRLVSLLADEEFQKSITGITVMRRYKRRHRCPNHGCKRPTKLVCPTCGEVDDSGNFEYMGNQFAITRPETFDRVSFAAENSIIPGGSVIGGERLICFAGDVQLMIMAYSNQPTARVTLQKVGKRRFSPTS